MTVSNDCFPSGDETPLNRAFQSGGHGTIVSLCPGSVHRLRSPIVFSAPRQTLTTAGGAKGRERAMIIVEGESQSTAIKADCKDCSHATISSVVVDGNRPQMLRVPMGDALVEIGNAEGQTVKDCRLYEPRGWSALHFREGDRLNCKKGYVADNEIGPCGEEWDNEYDGLIEKEPPWGNPRADGISLACKDSLVERNTVFDTTDGAIVLFGSSGTEVRENEIYSRTRVVLGGVNLVDYEPWAGDYSGVNVHHNTFYALSRYFKVGIVVGPSSWSDDTDTTVHGATVTDNVFHGDHFGYGIVVSSASDFTVVRNFIDDNARFDGVKGLSCPKAPENGKPTAFLINRGSARGSYQDNFVNGEVQHIICLDPPDEGETRYQPWRLRDSPMATAARAALEAAEHPEAVKFDSSGYDGRLAEALVNYQMILLTAMNAIDARIELQSGENANKPKRTAIVAVEEDEAVGSLSQDDGRVRAVAARLDSLERGGSTLRKGLENLGQDINTLGSKLQEFADGNRPILQSVYNSIKSYQRGGLAASPIVGGYEHEHMPHNAPRARQSTSSEIPEIHSAPDNTHAISSFGLFFAAGAVLALAVVIVRRWRIGRVSTSKNFKAR